MIPPGGLRRVAALLVLLSTGLLAGCAAGPAATSGPGSAAATATGPTTPAPDAAETAAPGAAPTDGAAPQAPPRTSAPQVAVPPVADGPPAPQAPGDVHRESAQRVALPWPAATGAAATALQAEVDGGAQPWLLDPSEVAMAYAAAAHDWPAPEAYPGPDGTSVDVRNADGERRTLSLTQPVRHGDDGIWVVTADQP